MAHTGVGAVACALVIPALMASLAAQAPQTTDRAVFAVASVKPSPRAPVARPRLDVSRDSVVAVHYPLWAVIDRAYGVTSTRVEQLPAWAQTAQFDIRAKAERPSSPAELLAMLRSLLEDRFQLKVHRETRVLETYTLAVDPVRYPGPGLRPVTIDCATNALAPDSEPGFFPAEVRPPCGTVVRSRTPKPTATELQDHYAAYTLSRFAASLEGALTRPVRDETHLPGVFDIAITFAIPLPPDVDRQRGWGAGTLSEAVMREALKTQLGLSLTSGRAPIDVLVVDSIERPSPD